jgi:uncharacterized membrane protein
LLVIILLSFWVKLTLLETRPLLLDERYEATQHIRHSVSFNLHHYRVDAQLFHVLLAMPMSYLGWEPALLRWVSLLAGILVIPVSYRLGKQLFDTRVALLAAAMFSVLPQAVIHFTAIRGYSFVILLCLASSIALINALKSERVHYWLLFALLITLALYTHISVGVFLVANYVYILWWIGRGPAHLPSRSRRRLLGGALLATLVIGIGIMGIAGLIIQSDTNVGNLQEVLQDDQVGDFTPFQLSDLGTTLSPYIDLLSEASFYRGRGWPLFFYGAIVLLGSIVGSVQRRQRWAIWYLMLVAILPLVVFTTIRTVVGPEFYGYTRYLSYSLFSFVILAANGIWWLSRKIGRDRWSVVVGSSVLLAGICVAPAFSALAATYSQWKSQQLVEVAHYLQENTSSTDLIFCVERDARHIRLKANLCLLSLHFFPDLADRAFSWQEIGNFRVWQNLLMPDRRCIAHYVHVPHTGLRVTCEDGPDNGPSVWLVFWQAQLPAIPYTWDSPLVEAQFGNTRLVHVTESQVLADNLAVAGDLVLADSVPSERSARNAFTLANMYASMADIPRASALLHSVSDADLETGESILGQVRELQRYLPHFGGAVLPETSSRATWGDQIQLLGYTLRSNTAGEGKHVITVTLFWQAIRPPKHDYSFFLHWRAEDNTNLGQVDYRPYDGLLPTTSWQSGEIVRETRTFEIPAPESGKIYRLVVGIYDAETMQRLPLQNDQSSENVLELANWP